MISNDYKKVIAVLKELDLKLSDPKIEENFRARLTIQKIVCLCKLMGIEFKKYRFSLYKNGPYSPDLTEDYYKHNERILSLDTDIFLTPLEKNIVNKIKSVILSHKLNLEHQSSLLEAVATAYFLKHKHKGITNNVLYKNTKEEKPYLSDNIITIAINLVVKLNCFT